MSMKSFTSKEFHGKKNALEAFLLMHQPDVLCLQETKISTWEECKSSFFPLNSLCAQMYSHVDSIADVQNGGASKGYSGTRTYIKKKQKWSSVKDSLSQTKANKHEENASFKINDAQHKFGFEHPVAQDGESIEHGKHDPDGRGITTFLDIHWSNECKPETIAVVNTYVPNSGLDSLAMMDYRINTFDTKLRSYLSYLNKNTAVKADFPSLFGRNDPLGLVIWTGDLNVCERDYDRFWSSRWKTMSLVPGCTPIEKHSFRSTLKESNMVDCFRHLRPTNGSDKNTKPQPAQGVYTFFSRRFQARTKGNGYRLDYFCISAAAVSRVKACFVHSDCPAELSDHVPLELWLSKE